VKGRNEEEKKNVELYQDVKRRETDENQEKDSRKCRIILAGIVQETRETE
jgi:hypothetical protein